MKATILLVALSLALGIADSRATSIQPLDLQKLNSQSSLIATGYVTAVKKVLVTNGFTEWEAKVAIASVLSGHYEQPVLTLRLRLGLVYFDRLLKVGDSGVFFLSPTADGKMDAAYPGSFALFQQGTVKALQRR